MKAAESTPGAPVRFAGPACAPASEPDELLLHQIRAGSEDAFAALVGRHHTAMIRVARSYVSSAVAEEVAQESWIAVLRGHDKFEGRSSFKTWLFRVLINRARTQAAREARNGRLTSATPRPEAEETLIEPWHFYPDDHARAGSWLVPPRTWTPEERLLSAETLERIEEEIETLPFLQRQVVTLRDVEGWTAREVCELLGITEIHQRVLLHRARTKLRSALENFFSERNNEKRRRK